VNRTIILLGHRGVGKSTLSKYISQLGMVEVHDIDHIIEEHTGKSCSELVSEDEENFRELERIVMKNLLSGAPIERPDLIVPGAGCDFLPLGPLYIWLRRGGWEEVAQKHRSRLRPELTWEEELAWMRQTREPTWAKHAHVVVDVPRGATIKTSIQWLTAPLRWLTDASVGQLSQRLWLVPDKPEQLDRALFDLDMFRFAGIEIRSDIFDEPPLNLSGTPHILSLRTPTPEWLALGASAATKLDIDLEYLPLARTFFHESEPKPLILSTHPKRCAIEDLEALIDAATKLAEDFPRWEPFISLKFAPSPESYAEIEAILDHPSLRRNSARSMTFLPQGDRFAWMRPWLAAHLNDHNYLPVGLSNWRVDHAVEQDKPTPYDLQAWLPFLIGATPIRYDALIGDPVLHSIGDVWHRSAALRSGEINRGYLKIPFGREDSDEELDTLLRLLERIDIRGVSITSPLKRRLAKHPAIESNLDAINTLRHVGPGQWKGIDTDRVGMTEVLSLLKHSSVTPGAIAMIGKGGVSPAVLTAISQTPGWFLAHHASAREGWTEDAPKEAQLVINAAGNFDNAYENAPECQVWLDLHYTDVREPPSGLHISGARFFEAQAQAQRDFWSKA
jgi:shikimate kinase